MRRLVPLTLVVGALACATPYRPASLGGAYSDYRQDDSTYVVRIHVSGYTRASTARAYLARRASEICAEQGFASYRVIDEASGDVALGETVTQAGGTTSSASGAANASTASSSDRTSHKADRVGRVRCTNATASAQHGSP